jgi:hypothetical protein
MTKRHKLSKPSPYRKVVTSADKKRYHTKKEAENIAEVQMLQNPGLELFVYKGSDGGWYLTRQQR